MALHLGALREALIEAGSSPEKAGRAAEELAGCDREFTELRAEMREGFFKVESKMAAEFADVRSDIKMLKFMLGAIFAALIPILLRALFPQ